MACKYPDSVSHTEGKVRSERMALNCPICLEIYKEPKSLTCLHTFCEQCIHSHVMKMKENSTLKAGIVCPLCKKVTVVRINETKPEEWTKQLPANYALVGLLQSVFGNEKSFGGQVKHVDLVTKCQPCLKRNNSVNASVFCANCPDYLCAECVDIHVVFSVTQGHTLVKIENIANNDRRDLLISMTKLDRCDTHSKQMKFYCGDHNKLCCSQCAIISHRFCKDLVETSKITTDEKHNTTQIVKSKLIDIQQKLKSTVNLFVENENAMYAQALEVDDKIQDIRVKLHRVVDEFENRILMATAAHQNQKSDEFTEGRKQCESLIAALDGSLYTHEAAVQYGSASQKFIAMHKLDEQYNSYANSTEEACSKLQSVQMKLELGDSFQKLLDPILTIVTVEPCSNVQHVEINLELGDHFKRVLDSTLKIGTLIVKSSKLVQDVKPLQLQLIASLDLKKTNAESEDPLITGMTYISDGRLVAVDNWNNRCMIMNEELTNVATFELDYPPLGIVHVGDNVVAITGGKNSKTIHKYQVREDGKLFHREAIRMKSSCSSISPIDSFHFAVGIYGEHTPASIVSKEGEQQFNVDFPFKANGFKASKSDDSRCAYMENGNLLILAVKDDHAVYIFDTKNNTQVVVKDDRIKEPRGIAVCNVGYFFVCSSLTNSIVQISSSGQIMNICTLNSMEWPVTICISEDHTKLAVSDYTDENRKIQVYDVSNLQC